MNLGIAVMLNVLLTRWHSATPARMALGSYFVTINKSDGFMLVTKIIL